MWDYRVRQSIAIMDLRRLRDEDPFAKDARPVVGFDPVSGILAVATKPHIVRLFSIDDMSFPFAIFNQLFQDQLPTHEDLNSGFTHLKFSPNGKDLILATNRKRVYCLDAFDGTLRWKSDVQSVPGFGTEKPSALHRNEEQWGVDISADGQYVMLGDRSYNLAAYSVKDGRFVARVQGGGKHRGTFANRNKFIDVVLWNPTFTMFAATQGNEMVCAFLVDFVRCG